MSCLKGDGFVRNGFNEMKSILQRKLNILLIWVFLTGLFAVSVPTVFALETGNRNGEYDVHLSWFIDLEQYDQSAHGDLFCVQCHQSVKDQALHPDPALMTAGVEDFFEKAQCAGSECHENTLADFEKGVHGRIRFENREKYSDCVDCHDPHTVRMEHPEKKTESDPAGRELCAEGSGRDGLPAECVADEACLECHSMPEDKPAAIEKETKLCFHCHDQTGDVAKNPDFKHMPILDAPAYHTTQHVGNRCSECHTRSATYGHDKTVQDCRECHQPHHEAENHDPHVGVDCRACHLQGIVKVDRINGLLNWRPAWPRSRTTTVHQFVDTEDEASCTRCHADDNPFGAAASVLPAKGVFCISCHTATFSVTDATTFITLIISLLIFMGLLSLWLSAGPEPAAGRGPVAGIKLLLRGILTVVFSRRIAGVLKAVLLDAIIQRKLFVQSKWRWFSHGLIFYSFLLRFGWGLFSLLLSLAFPEWELTSALLDKNNPLVAFTFDLTGVLIISGVILVVWRKLASRKATWPGLPRQEWFSHTLIGGIILVGFVLEGVRIAMTLDLGDKHYAFLGYAISQIFINLKGLTQIYGYIWYLHAILTAAFVIWLPFSRMFHIVMAPVAIAVSAATKHGHQDDQE